jgi:hypothetical protein
MATYAEWAFWPRTMTGNEAVTAMTIKTRAVSMFAPPYELQLHRRERLPMTRCTLVIGGLDAMTPQ